MVWTNPDVHMEVLLWRLISQQVILTEKYLLRRIFTFFNSKEITIWFSQSKMVQPISSFITFLTGDHSFKHGCFPI